MILLEFEASKPSEGPRAIFGCEISAAGGVTAVYTVLASRKLIGVRWG
jgi:hypothetical protein